MNYWFSGTNFNSRYNHSNLKPNLEKPSRNGLLKRPRIALRNSTSSSLSPEDAVLPPQLSSSKFSTSAIPTQFRGFELKFRYRFVGFDDNLLCLGVDNNPGDTRLAHTRKLVPRNLVFADSQWWCNHFSSSTSLVNSRDCALGYC